MLKRVFGRSHVPEPDEQALLEPLRSNVGADLLAAFVGSSELPTSDAAGVDMLLLRYLHAEKRDVAKALARLQKQAAWRRGWGTVSEADVWQELQLGKVKLQPPTQSSGGRPLLIVKGRLHKSGNPPLLLNQFIYFCLEAAAHYCAHPDNPDGKLVAVFDLDALQLRNLDSAALRASFSMLEQHFPERVAEIWMFEAPTIFWGIWKVVHPFIDATTRSRIHFVYGKEGRAAMLKSLGPDVLPLELGGRAAEVAVEHAAQQLAAWRVKVALHAPQTDEAALAQAAGGHQLRLSGSAPDIPAA